MCRFIKFINQWIFNFLTFFSRFKFTSMERSNKLQTLHKLNIAWTINLFLRSWCSLCDDQCDTQWGTQCAKLRERRTREWRIHHYEVGSHCAPHCVSHGYRIVNIKQRTIILQTSTLERNIWLHQITFWLNFIWISGLIWWDILLSSVVQWKKGKFYQMAE